MLKLSYLVLYVKQVKREEHFIALKEEGKHIFLSPPLTIEHAGCYLLTKEISQHVQILVSSVFLSDSANLAFPPLFY
jgi:hypothetical protein